jgi:hypothetical protein
MNLDRFARMDYLRPLLGNRCALSALSRQVIRDTNLDKAPLAPRRGFLMGSKGLNLASTQVPGTQGMFMPAPQGGHRSVARNEPSGVCMGS